MKVSSFFLFCSGLENVSDTPAAYQSRSAACVEITPSSFYHKSKNIELPLGWLDIFFLSIFFAYERVIAEPAIYAILNKKEESAYEDYVRRCCP